MSKTASRFESKLMRVAVYRVENEPLRFPLRRCGESAFGLHIKLRCLAREEVYSDRDEAAAAQVYYDAVGRHRVRRMRALNAPAMIIAAEASLKRIESELRRVSFLSEYAYLLDNMAEAWLMTVDWDGVEPSSFDLQKNQEDTTNAN